MSQFDYDLFVIGAGSGGVRAARTAAGLGVNVAIAENKYFGGTCVNVGCVPKKLFVYASEYSDAFKAAQGFGWGVSKPAFDWSVLMQQKNTEINRLQGIYENLLNNTDVTIFQGQAQLLDANTVQVNGQSYRCERILIATGGWPSVPEITGKEHIVTSNEIFALEKLPERILIVGGGYIAVEFAGILNGLGVETVLSYRGEQILRGFDQDIQEFIHDEMIKKGIDIQLNSQVKAISKEQEHYQVSFADGNLLETDLILYATGRTPNTQALGLEQLGVIMDSKGAIKVNQNYQTNLQSVYALGDVTNRVNLTPVATAEAMALVNHLYKDQPIEMDYQNIPTAVFTQPNIATVGMTEKEAREEFDDIAVFRSEFKAMKHTLSGIDERVMMKMLVRKSTDQVLGLHMVGENAGEIIQGMAVAIKAGATKAVFDATIGIHPTAAEEFVTMR